MEDNYSNNDYGASPLYTRSKQQMMKVKVAKRGMSTQIPSALVSQRLDFSSPKN